MAKCVVCDEDAGKGEGYGGRPMCWECHKIEIRSEPPDTSPSEVYDKDRLFRCVRCKLLFGNEKLAAEMDNKKMCVGCYDKQWNTPPTPKLLLAHLKIPEGLTVTALELDVAGPCTVKFVMERVEG